MCVSAENEAPIRFRAVHVTPWTILFSLSWRQRTEMTSSARQDNTFDFSRGVGGPGNQHFTQPSHVNCN